MGKGHARNEDVYLNKDGANEVTAANAKDSVDKKHTQNTDTKLDNGVVEVDANDNIKFLSDKLVICGVFTSAGINAAIDALGAEGGEVYLPEGDYDITASIVIDYANITLRGAGRGTRLLATNRFVYTTVTGTPAAGETITGDTTGYTATVVQVDTVNKIVWYHTLSNAANFNDGEIISWSGGADTTISGAPTEQNFIVISTNAKTGVIISDLCIYGGSGGGNSNALIGNGDNANSLTVENCYLYYSDSTAVHTAGDYSNISRNYLEGNDTYGIYIQSGNFTVVSDNILKDIDYRGIEIYTSDNVVVADNIVDGTNSYEGIRVYSSNHGLITGNVVKGSSGSGIRIDISNYCSIDGNSIWNTANGNADIWVNDADYSVISNNTLYGDGSTGDIGIHLDESDYCIVTGNFSTGHDVTGIQEDSDCQNNLIYGNNCQDSTPYMINGTSPETFNINGNLRTNISEWYYCKYIDAINLAVGASGATQTIPSADTLGGYQLDADTEYLYSNGRVCNNWDGETDIEVKVTFEVNVDNTGGADADTVDFDLLCYYRGNSESAMKTQTPGGSVTVGKAAQYTQFTATILIDHDKVDHLVEVGDKFALRLNLNTTDSEVDNVIVNTLRWRYKTKMPQPEI